VTLLALDDFYSKVDRIVKDDLLRLLRQNAVAGHVADIRLVPIKFNLAAIHVPSPVYRFCRYTGASLQCASISPLAHWKRGLIQARHSYKNVWISDSYLESFETYDAVPKHCRIALETGLRIRIHL
jgi:hypothetical protein